MGYHHHQVGKSKLTTWSIRRRSCKGQTYTNRSKTIWIVKNNRNRLIADGKWSGISPQKASYKSPHFIGIVNNRSLEPYIYNNRNTLIIKKFYIFNNTWHGSESPMALAIYKSSFFNFYLHKKKTNSNSRKYTSKYKTNHKY